MSITLYPSKLLMGEMEARIPGGLTLLPGQLLRFEGTTPAYGRIIGVRAVRKKAAPSAEGKSKSRLAGYIVRLQLLHGQPDFSPQTVTILDDAQMALEVQRLQEPIEHPLVLSPDFTADAGRLGPFTVIEGGDFVLKYETLITFIKAVQPHQKVLIIDPLGLFDSESGLHYCQAGKDVRLSLQTVGHQKFLDAFGELFPGGLRNWALQAIAASWPITQDFIGLERLLDWRSISESPLKSLILQNQQAVLSAGIFAERPNQVLQWTSLIWKNVNVLDLSTIPTYWKPLFYEETVRLIFQEGDGSVLPVLIYPEHYLGHWPNWLKEAEESGLNQLVLASSQETDAFKKVASTRITADARDAIRIQGRLTAGLPVVISLNGVQESSIKTKSHVEQPVHEERTDIETLTPPDEAGTRFADEQWMPQQQEALQQPIRENQQILDQLFANQISIEQSVTGRRAAPPPMPEPQYEPPRELQIVDQAKYEQQPVVQPSNLNYPDAEEGAWTEAVYPQEVQQVAASAPSQDVSFPDSWTLDDFDFDLNLDQKPLSQEAMAAQLEYAGVSMTDLGSMPGTLSEIAPESMLTWSGTEESAGPVDLHQATEAMLGDEVPVYHRAAEPISPNTPSYQPGDRVKHEKYGLGVVTKVVPMHDSVVLNITFESVGKRLLDPQLAQLSREPG